MGRKRIVHPMPFIAVLVKHPFFCQIFKKFLRIGSTEFLSILKWQLIGGTLHMVD
ncbi:Uncharacterised protein [Mycobacteroides abscessus subsp. abscessus]|nr:Uncharacterised protein [Mycobacteroides abscessus subsp. abscessus]